MNQLKTILISLACGILIGAVLTVYLQRQSITYKADTSIASDVDSVGSTTNSPSALGLDLSPAFVEDEMARNGKVVRIKKKGGETEQQYSQEKQRKGEEIKIEIKQLLNNDPVLSGQSMTVLVRKGRVTLTGATLPPSQIGRAIALAFNVEGVVSVTSTLEVKARKK